MKFIGESLAGFQAALKEAGSGLQDYVKEEYVDKWTSDMIYHAMAIRTTYVNAMHNFLSDRGLFNLERVSMSPVTDPLAHDIEHTPTISYKGIPYKTTHSMIYSKFLSCFNKRMKGVFVDSPNIRLELEHPRGEQREKYLVDFSQMDIEVRRESQLTQDDYYNNKELVQKTLKEDYEGAIRFFEELMIAAVTAVIEKNSDDLTALGVKWEIPVAPFPRMSKDEAVQKYGKNYEKEMGKELGTQFFWITGLMRENYDLIYPYLEKDGSKKAIREFASEDIYNYDLCAQSFSLDGTASDAFEIMSGAIREWLYEPIIERLLDNGIIKTKPQWEEGQIVNIEELEGYGPFLAAASLKDDEGKPYFPATFGGGIGVERSLFALLRGPVIKKVDDLTLFGKNPDSKAVYLY